MRPELMFEHEFESGSRAGAAAATVWDELWPLEHLIENVRTISSYEVAVDGDRATFTGGLSRWPALWREAAGTAELIEAVPRERLRWRVVIPTLEFEFTGSFELTPAGTQETNLVYRGALLCADPCAGRLRHVLTGLLETHLESVAERVATRASRRTSAARALEGA